ncbi:MAG TPA: sigma-70 family RNA polymerase sigma factor [Firmicutes bacterium]|jgi:RNA polymerase sporulation-specific sigma factor|nr:sigma-70 family RNA polymerase sigma factor [Bacillota bacterium]
MFVDACLFKKIKKGDALARDQFFNANTGLIWSCVRKYSGLLEKDDLFQLGAIGLLKAIDRFDPAYGVAFSTYAVPLILGEIRRYLRDQGDVKVSRRLREISLTARRLSSRKQAETGKEPSIEELAGALGIDIDSLCQALDATQPVLYFDDLPPSSESAATEMQPYDLETQADSLDVKEAVSRLGDCLRPIIEGRFFQGKTQYEISRDLGVSQAQVSRLEKKALLLLRQILQGREAGFNLGAKGDTTNRRDKQEEP